MSSSPVRSCLWIFFFALGACGAESPASQQPSAAAPLETTFTVVSPSASVTAVTPATSASAPVAAAPSFEETVRRFVKESTAAWASRDSKRHVALFTADAVIANGAASGWDEGTVGDMETSIAGISAAFPDLEVSYTRVVARAPYAVVEWTFTGTHKGELLGHPATGKKVGYRAASLFTFTPDGKVMRKSNYLDVDTMLGQLGFGAKGQAVRAVEPKPSTPPLFLFAGQGDDDAVARSWLSLAEKADTEKLGSLASDDVVISSQFMPTDTKGKKALLKELGESGKAFVDAKTTLAICIPTATVIACEYAWRATWKGPAMGMKPTGRTGSVHSLELFELKDGKVTRATAYANGAEFAGTFGVAAQPLKKR